MPPAPKSRYSARPAPREIPWKEWPRATAVATVGTSSVLMAINALDDTHPAIAVGVHSPVIACFILAYMLLLILSRVHLHGTYIIYELLWGCNVSMFLAAAGMLLSKPLMISTAMAVVSGDQLCWYIDAAAYAWNGTFPVGVIKYLTYPENQSFPKRFFATHHIWFLPTCLWVLYGNGGMNLYSFLYATLVTSVLVTYTRIFTDFQAVDTTNKKHIIYLNINGAYEFWKDIKIPVLHYFDHRHPLIYLPYLSLTGNLVANGVPHLVLLLISQILEQRTIFFKHV